MYNFGLELERKVIVFFIIVEFCIYVYFGRLRIHGSPQFFKIRLVVRSKLISKFIIYILEIKSKKVKTGYLYSGTVSMRNRWVSLILLRFARPQCLAATHLSSPEVGNGLSWPKPQCTCNAMVIIARHSTAPTREYYAVIQRAQC